MFGGQAAKRVKVEEAGPMRVVPHVEGNWATYVFIRLSEVEFLGELLDLQSQLKDKLLVGFPELKMTV